jgi:hypothetical protein
MHAMRASFQDEDVELTVSKLLSAGADIEAKDNRGKTALFCAFVHDACTDAKLPTRVSMLLDFGANVEEKDCLKETLLVRAVEPDMSEIWKWLVERGADPKVKDREGRTALEVMEDRKPEKEKKDLEGEKVKGEEEDRGRREASSVHSEHVSGTVSRSGSSHSGTGSVE